MRQLLRFSIHHPLIILGVVAAISTLLALFIPRVQLRLDARSLIPAGHPDLAASDVAAANFGVRDVIMVGIARADSDVYNVATLNRIARLSEKVGHTKGVVASSVRSIASTPGLFIRDNKLDVRPLLSRDSIYDSDATERIRADVKALGLNDGVLVSRDGRAAAIIAEITPDAERTQLLQHLEALKLEELRDGDSIYLAGTGPAQAVLGEASARDLMRLVPLVILVLGIALTVGFRRPAFAFISLVEIATSLIWTVGLIGLTGQSIFVTTLVLPVILIAVGVSDDVYVFKRYLVEPNHAADETNKSRLLTVFGSLVWPIGLTTISTVIGLLSMAATSLQPLRIFGLFGALAVVFSTLFTFTLVPALSTLMYRRRPRNERPPEQSTRTPLTSLYSTMVTVGPGRILLLFALATVAALLLTTRLRVDDSWVKNLPAKSEVARGDEALNKLLAGTTTVDFMVDTRQPSGFLQARTIRLLLALEDRLSTLSFVGASHGIHDDVLRVNASLHGMDYTSYRAAVTSGKLELTPGEVEQALMLLTVARRAPIGEWIDGGYRRARLTVFIKSANYERIASVLRTTLATDDVSPIADVEITPFGDGWISYTTVRLLVEGQIYSITLALGADLLMLSLLLGSVRFSLISIIPVAFSVLFVFATLALTGTSLGIANSMFAGIAIGIGLDFAIHLTVSYRREFCQEVSAQEAMRRAFIGTGPAILTSAASIALGFSVLTLSDILPNAQLGLMISLSLIVCACASLVVIPCLVLARTGAKLP